MVAEKQYFFPLEMKDQEKEIRENFWKCLYTSAEKEMLHYWLLLPQNVKPAELKPITFQEVGLTNIGRYIADDTGPYIEVWAAYEHCQWEMNASDWLINKLDLMGEKVLSQRIITHPSGSGKFADILSIKTMPSGDEVVSRYTVQKDYNPVNGGGNYFLLKTACASKDYNTIADTIFLIAINWDLLHRSNLMLSELLKTVSLSNKNDSGFKIPDSWLVNMLDDNRLVIEHTIGNVNHGVINFCLFRQAGYPAAQAIFDEATARFNRHDSAVSLTTSDIASIPNDINPSFTGDLYSCTGEVVSAAENIRAYYDMRIFKMNDLWCYVEVVGPHRNHQDYYYEANKRCMEIILSTFRIEKR
ncbi:hypothetical protein [Enterobacter bugandensis]|uniref:Uncharacterized protein n=1 Tax=Enterobacter bugandensis TaxID=881260 RepID=A0A822WPI0_9ENTR|nr:hypothetical protein [Enterobacter bugandensis]MCK7400627.1 hypothetical protein [Enterobacter bugandensis]QCE28862.1 hypothetical protein FAI37_16195 [Enterobacter bugandensis]CZX16008.1 Uncharacterised protein [Enterobacter bugandensis]